MLLRIASLVCNALSAATGLGDVGKEHHDLVPQGRIDHRMAITIGSLEVEAADHVIPRLHQRHKDGKLSPGIDAQSGSRAADQGVAIRARDFGSRPIHVHDRVIHGASVAVNEFQPEITCRQVAVEGFDIEFVTQDMGLRTTELRAHADDVGKGGKPLVIAVGSSGGIRRRCRCP